MRLQSYFPIEYQKQVSGSLILPEQHCAAHKLLVLRTHEHLLQRRPAYTIKQPYFFDEGDLVSEFLALEVACEAEVEGFDVQLQQIAE